MRFLLVFMVLLNGAYASTQPMILRVLGLTDCIEKPFMFGYNIPQSAKAVLPDLQDRLHQLQLYLDSTGIQYQVKDHDIPSTAGSPEALLQWQTFSKADYGVMEYKLRQLSIPGGPAYAYAPRNYSSTDTLAIHAVEDARKQAEITAAALDKQIKRVHYIDDEVDRMWFYIEWFPELMCPSGVAPGILDMIEIMFTYNPGKEPGDRVSQYAIWVGFELVDE